MADDTSIIGKARPRIDGPAKVTGAARYPSDEPAPGAVWAFLVTSAIARGKVKSFDLDEAKAVPGVLDILTHWNVGGDAKPPAPTSKGKPTTTLESDRIWHDGQIIAVVVAETYEAAREAANRVHVDYDEEKPSATFGSPGAQEEKREPGDHEDPKIGDPEKAFGAAPVKIDQRYETPTQHHNPMELFTTTCFWQGDKLTIYEPSQFVYGLKNNVAKQLGIDPAKVTVVSRFTGGAFGSKGGTTARTAWIAVAARRLKRPVKLVATRDQGFTIATYRAETRHRLRLGADANGRLTALIHEGWELTSRPSQYNVSGTESTARIYACPNVETAVNLVHADRNTPGFMRAPPDTPYMFPLESAMDELAYALKMDPVELRRLNDAPKDPINGLPWSSRSLMKCYDAAAERFGWKQRNPVPGAMRDGDWKIGWGCATAAYPSNIAPCGATVRLDGDKASIGLAGQDLGTGAYTVIAMTAAQALKLPVENVSVELGHTDLPAASLAAGSSHTASICHAVAAACDKVNAKRAQGETGVIEETAANVPNGLPDSAMDKINHGQMAISRGFGRKDCTAYAFGAHFIEVRVHGRTGEIRTPRMVSAFASGTIINPLTAYSQYMGGMIWGISAALFEKTEIDLRAARYTNDNLADYLIPVNADAPEIDVLLVPEEDNAVNPMGIKGIGEIGIVGVNAAVANAVFHATGRRIRRLPIRIEDMV